MYDKVIPDEPVFLEYNKKTHNGKIVIVEKNGKPQIRIIDLQEDKEYTPSSFCKKYIGYECNGWVKLYVIRDGKKVKLSNLREAPPTRKRAKSSTTEKKNTNSKTKKNLGKTPSRSPSSMVSMTPPPPPSRSVSPRSSSSSLVSMTPPPPPSRSVSPSPPPLLINKPSPKKPSPKKPSPKKPSPKKHTSSIDGASIILWYQNGTTPMILVGTESNYLSDIHPEVKEYQTVSESYLEKAKDLSRFHPEVEKAKHYFRIKTEELQKRYSITKIQYDNPKKIGDSYHINYRYLSDNAKRGIVKGQMEENENVKETILREVAEEVGVKIEKKTQYKIVEHGVCNKYNVFSMKIDEEGGPKEFNDRIEQRIKKKLGEVFDLKFEPLCSVLSSLSSFNNRSKCAIEKFRDYQNACNN
jgi:hypothetical protein